ncbi:UNVERIFIED_CONTAM: hypothetical protein GTU68_049694 [Idotea baltica]|nr:hypothetical protein [Idotea baltica]
MFSGKTEELIRRLRRVQFADQQMEVFKPSIDVRYDEEEIVSHNKNAIISTPVDSAQQILLYTQAKTQVVGIDEAQFLDEELGYVCEELANRGIRVIVAGLDMDFTGKPFGAMPALLAKADYVTKLHAICMQCGSLATYSYRFSAEESTVLLGEKEAYEPRCRTCFTKGKALEPRPITVETKTEEEL